MSDAEALNETYRKIPGWETKRPPGGFVLPQAKGNEVSPEYDPFGVGVSIVNPLDNKGDFNPHAFTTASQRQSVVPTGLAKPPGAAVVSNQQYQNANTPEAAAYPGFPQEASPAAVQPPIPPQHATALAGPPSINMVGPTAETTTEKVAKEKGPEAPEICVIMEFDNIKIRTEAYFHDVRLSDDDTHVILMFDNRCFGFKQVHIEPCDIPLAIHVVGSERILVTDASRPLKFVFKQWDFCALPITEIVPHV